MLRPAIGLLLAVSVSYQTEILRWRDARERDLRAEGGWLSVAGLFWLAEGANTFGSASSNRIVLPDGPARAGTIDLHGGKITVESKGERRELRPDSADSFPVGRLKLSAIRRGGRWGIRLRDPRSKYRREFTGLRYFPVDESWRVRARFVAEPSRIPILNVLGQTAPLPSPGYAVFRVRGQEVRLYPVVENPDAKQLFIIFRDRTSGKETYGAGRFLEADFPRNGTIVLDFNKAYNPPCAFTPYATCPLPPARNRLPVRIEAGELSYSSH